MEGTVPLFSMSARRLKPMANSGLLCCRASRWLASTTSRYFSRSFSRIFSFADSGPGTHKGKASLSY